MKLTKHSASLTEVETVNGYTWYSYNTAVVVFVKSTGETYVTETYYSRTTSRHIKQALEELLRGDHSKLQTVSQERIDALVA